MLFTGRVFVLVGMILLLFLGTSFLSCKASGDLDTVEKDNQKEEQEDVGSGVGYITTFYPDQYEFSCGRTYIRTADLADGLGYESRWDGDNERVYLGDKGFSPAVCNQYFLESWVEEGRTWLPIRFVAESLCYQVIWDSDSGNIDILYTGVCTSAEEVVCSEIYKEEEDNLLGSIGNWKKFNVTAYTLREEECGKPPEHPHYGITFSGAPAVVGITVAAGPYYEIGTIIEIEGYGLRVVQDRGSAVGNRSLDIFFGDPELDPEVVSRALSFGIRDLNARVILKGDGNPYVSWEELQNIQSLLEEME